MRMFIALLFSFFISGCDPEGKKQCEWVLEPEPKLQGKSDEGFIPVCARNRRTMKQDCRLQTTLEYAQNALNKKFRYDDLKVENFGLPRTIKSIDFCE